MADLERFAGWSELEGRWQRERQALLDAVYTNCWDDTNGWLTDLPKHSCASNNSESSEVISTNSVSIHAQVQATLAGLWSADDAADVLSRVLTNDDATQPGTLYYRAHLAEALRRANRRDLVHDLYPRWFAMLDGTGIGTWPESDHLGRSDCHGWGAAPDLELVHTILGVVPDPAADGWGRALITPELGNLTRAGGRPNAAWPNRHYCGTRGAGHHVTGSSPVPVVIANQQHPAGSFDVTC